MDTVKTIGAEARNMAETASYEARSWVITIGAQVRGVVYLAALFLGAFALGLLLTSLRSFWPTWPSPYAHPQRLHPPEETSGYAGAPNLSLEIRRRGQSARAMGLRNLSSAENLRPGATCRGVQEPQLGASPPWLAGLQQGALVSFVYGQETQSSAAANARQEGVVQAVRRLEDGGLILEVREGKDGRYSKYDVKLIQDMKVASGPLPRAQFVEEVGAPTRRNKSEPARDSPPPARRSSCPGQFTRKRR